MNIVHMYNKYTYIYFIIKNHKRTEHLRRVVKIDRYSGGFLVTFFLRPSSINYVKNSCYM